MYEQLRKRFEQNTRKRLAEMREQLGALDRGEAGAMKALSRHFHGLAGLGATLGYPRITELAAAGERISQPYRQSGGVVSEDEVRQWKTIVDEIASALDSPAVMKEGELPSPSVTQMSFDVLVAVPEGELAANLDRMLRAEGYAVRLAHSAAAARACMSAKLPNALIVSAHLPDGSGCNVVRALRNFPASDAVMTALVTVGNERVDRVEAIRSGVDAVFEAPVDTKALLRRLAIAYQTQCGPSARILIVEDEPEQVGILTAILEAAGYETKSCDGSSDVSGVIASFRPDLILLDIHLPGETTGHEIARMLRQDERYATTPVVFVTTETGMSSMIGTIKAGGDDHLVKPVHPAVLITVINSRLQRAQLLRALVDRDGLTGLLTHSTFRQQLDHAASPQRSGDDSRAALVMIDVDHFKSVNDRFGHRTGDRVLGALGAFLRRRLRQSDVIARYGGEEFALLLRNLTEEDSVRLVTGLLQEFSTVEHQAPSEKFRVTFSAGVAMLEAVPSRKPDDWIEAADRALYDAKREGRARVNSIRRLVSAVA